MYPDLDTHVEPLKKLISNREKNLEYPIKKAQTIKHYCLVF